MSSISAPPPAPPAGAASAAPAADDRYRVGTLRYSVGGLATVFAWLLWGDFCFTLMEYVNNSVVPLRLRQLNAPDWVMPIILTTVPNIINFVLNPIISTASDRFRSRWGRRIPFLLFGTPFITLSLVLMAFAPELGAWLHGGLGGFGGFSPTGVAIVTVGILLGTFKVFDLFVNTTFWYLFNDVVPQAFMARFLGLFRVVGSLAAMGYNYFFYEHAVTHMRWIYLGAAGIYFFGFTLMCLRVKEGEYPPPEPRPKTRRGLAAAWLAARTYVRQCLSHRVYAYFFLQQIFISMASAIGIYQLFLNLSLGITLQQLALLNTGIQFGQLLINYPAGAIADRFHPVRVMLWMAFALVGAASLHLVWALGSFEPTQAFHILIVISAIDQPIIFLYGALAIPAMMRLFPRDQFGQFCSFNALCGSGTSIAASILVGVFMTQMRHVFPDDTWGKDFCYRLMPLWRVPLVVLATVFVWLLIREWKRLGGVKNYTPPGLPPAAS
jgi:maltose/moltooligosaccharide transporter